MGGGGAGKLAAAFTKGAGGEGGKSLSVFFLKRGDPPPNILAMQIFLFFPHMLFHGECGGGGEICKKKFPKKKRFFFPTPGRRGLVGGPCPGAKRGVGPYFFIYTPRVLLKYHFCFLPPPSGVGRERAG